MQSYSLSELLRTIQFAVSAAFPDSYWVRAEISSLSARPNGHCYMELAEGASGSEYAAKIKANCWKNIWTGLSAHFLETVGQPVRTGMQVLVRVSVEMHPVFGLSLTVLDIDPSFTLGDLAQRKAEALKRLEEEGIIDMQKGLSLPTLPRRIAVISAPTAAGYQDFEHQLKNNPEGYTFLTTLFPATMQGDTAAESIVNALQAIYNHEEAFDAVVIIRGGGAVTDLSCFDQYELAAHCAQFPLPVIAGIGHTRDISLVDRVAFISVKTPTAAAEYLISRFAEQDSALTQLTERLVRSADTQIRTRTTVLERIDKQLCMSVRTRLQRSHSTLELIEQTVRLHSPERIFRMGYSLTRCGGKVVRSAADLKPGDVLTTTFEAGRAESRVDKTDLK